MASLLKQISFSIFLLISATLNGQKVKFELAFPLLSYHVDNIADIEDGLNTSYANGLIPQFRFAVNYRRIIGGIEHYYYGEGSGIISPNEGQINSIRIKSFSALIGYELYELNRLSIKIGSGVTYHQPNLALYNDTNIHVWGGTACWEENRWGALFWLTLNRQIFDHWNVGFNFRFNPMFSEFGVNPNANCIIPHEHDRLNYFVTQLMLGYEF